MDNIEKSAFRPKQYTGYAPISGVWHIRKIHKTWVATCQTGRDALGYVSRSTLREISYELRTR
jgi:hypothetical protein